MFMCNCCNVEETRLTSNSSILYDPPPRIMEIKAKINKWDLIKLKSFFTMKETISKVKRQPSEWEKIIVNKATDKKLISKIYMQLNSRKINDPIKKWAKELNRHFSKEDYRWLINTWKDAQHHSLLEKFKSKPQWGIISRWSEWPPSKCLQNNKCWRGCGEKVTLLNRWWECKLVEPLWRKVWKFF